MRASFHRTNLTKADLTGAGMTAAILRGPTMNGTTLSGAQWLNLVLSGNVKSSGLVGTPDNLPSGWSIVSGTLYWLYGS